MSTPVNPYEPPLADPDPSEEKSVEENPYWGRPTLLDWYGNLGLRGKLAWIGGIFLVANGLAWLFGFFWPRMLIAGVVALAASIVIPSSVDD
ncbi:MAG: hypothetical protein V4726_06940 [Verrucomicrobiota bacterium]